MTDIGATLREARMRDRIDVSEIEAKTKIRARYLRALENEEWDLLPGPTFVRSFLRTYAQALGLDGKALVEEYRLRFEPPSDLEHQPVVAAPRRIGARYVPVRAGSGPSRGYLLAVGAVGAAIVLLVVALATTGGKGKATPKAAGHRTGQVGRSQPSRVAAPASRTGNATRVALSLEPTAPVYVCLIGEGNRKLIPGVIIQPPYTPVTFHAAHFELTLGNNAVTLYVDGRPSSVPASSRAIGYSITGAGRRALAPGRLPTCA
jgi:helix-turn-helix protein